jgi:anti-sigma factor RsiW
MDAMNCRHARQQLFDFIDGMSHEVLRAELDRHIGECAECERFAAELTKSLALLHRSPMEPLDENFNWKVRLAIHRERNQARSRTEASGAWARAWNRRYALSAGVAFGLVLVVGAVALREATGPAVTPGAPAQVSRDYPVNPTELVPHPSSNAGRVGQEVMVSSGGNSSAPSGASHGAIDEATTEATIDSLVAADLMRMTPEERSAYIQRRIIRLRLHLQGQQETPVRP